MTLTNDILRATVNNLGATLIMHRKAGGELRDTGKEKFQQRTTT